MAQTTKQRKTAEQRRAGWYGTKRYAVVVLRENVRAYAKLCRIARITQSDSVIRERSELNARFLGAWSALSAVGALPLEQLDRWMKRLQRIQHARISRRPFELRRAA